jgi:hypothetical protein
MITRKKTTVKESIFHRDYEFRINTRTIVPGDIIKINGEYGSKFKFHSLVTNTKTGVQWVDCFEIQKGVTSAWRSFRSDRIKVIPIKRGKRNVDRG